MAISINSQDFRDTAKELEELAAQGVLDQETINKIVESKGFDSTEFKETFTKYVKTPSEELDKQAQLTNIPIVDPIIRTVGTAVGKAQRGLANTTEDFFPEFKAKVDNILDKTGEYVPEVVKEYSDQIFNPYHGDGVYGQAEEMVGNVGSYFVPAIGFIKSSRLVSGLAKNAKLINFGSRAAQLNQAIKTNKTLTNATKIKGKYGKIATIAKNLALYGTAYAASATIVEDPQENGVNFLLEKFPESASSLESLAINPNDTAAQQRVQAFINNMGLEVAFFGGLKGLMVTYKGIKEGTKKVIPTQLSKLLAGTTSKRGLSDDVLANFVKQDAVAKNAYDTAVIESRELSKLMKKDKFDSVENIAVVNEALAGNKSALAQLPSLVKPKIIGMRKEIDDLSGYFLQNNRTSGGLKVTIDENLQTYITRTFEMFENPSYIREMKSVLKKNRKNISNNQLSSIANKGMRDISDYLINTMNITPDEAYVNIKLALKNYDGDKGLFLSDLAGTAGSKTGSSVKGFFKRKKLDEKVKSFLGEVKDPNLNYVNAYQKLAVYKSEIDFLETLGKDMLNNGAAKKAVKNKEGVFAPADVGNREAAKTVVEERLSKIFGKGVVDAGTLKNPLQGLYIDPNYKKALEVGLQTINPTSNIVMKNWLRLKTASQLGLTAMNPATHSVNVLGNNLFMAANGFIPNTRGVLDAAEFASRSLLKLTNKRLVEKWNRYRELGITGTDVYAETIRANIKQMSGPSKIYDKPSIGRKIRNLPLTATKKTINKIIDVYQVEDDIYKIMHFESTKKYLTKAFPEASISKIEDMAAKRTRDLMPNYKIAPKYLKKLRFMPIGDFATFAAESTRVAKNIVAYTIEDGLSGNPELMSLAARRLGGMTTVGLGADVLQSKSMLMMGITEDEKEAIDIVGPQYNYDVPQFYLSPIESKNGKKVVKTVSTGSLDPFSYIKSAARFTHSILNDDNMSIEKLKNIRYEPELQKMGLAMVHKTLSPFVGTSVITDSLLENAMLIKEGKNLPKDILNAGINLGLDITLPAFTNYLKKAAEADDQVGYFPEDEKTKGVARSLLSGDYKGVPGEANPLSLLGFKVNAIDLSSSIPYNIGYDLSNINKNKEISKLLQGKRDSLSDIGALLGKGVGSRTYSINEEDLKKAKDADELNMLKTEKELRMYIKSYKALGFNMEEIVKNLKNPTNINILRRINSNYHTPSKLTKSDIQNYIKGLKKIGVNLPVDYFKKIDDKLLNAKIDEVD